MVLGFRSVGGAYDSLDQNKDIDTINLKFVEAREEIEMTLDDRRRERRRRRPVSTIGVLH